MVLRGRSLLPSPAPLDEDPDIVSGKVGRFLFSSARRTAAPTMDSPRPLPTAPLALAHESKRPRVCSTRHSGLGVLRVEFDRSVPWNAN